jgi:hypothetical protein
VFLSFDIFFPSTSNLHPTSFKNPPTIAARKSPDQSPPAQCSEDRPPSVSYMRNFPRAVGHQTSHPGLANANGIAATMAVGSDDDVDDNGSGGGGRGNICYKG